MRSAVLRLLMLGAVLIAPLTCEAAAGSIDIADRYPVVNEPTLIHVRNSYGQSVEGAVIRVTYRPESRVETTDSLGTTNDAGIVHWTPEDVGVVTISAAWMEGDSTTGAATQNISIKFASTPANGIAIMVFAGFILLGGSIIRLSRLIRESNHT